MQLAVLDHNAHVNCEHYKNKSGDGVYHRKYRKASKLWDVTPTVVKKDYKYIPGLMKEILDYKGRSPQHMKQVLPLPPQHPSCIQSMIAHKEPAPTLEIVQRKSSRF